MGFVATPFEDLFVFEPRIFSDSRGYFFESFNEKLFEEELNQSFHFVQDNQSKSNYGTLRGLHFQKGEFAQRKLVRVLSGVILDVVLDLRPESKTFKKHLSIELSDENKKQLLVPKGFAHGFVALSESAEVFYKCDNYYNPQAEGGIYFGDPDLGIDWKVPHHKLIVSEKDQKNITLKKYLDQE